MKSHHNLQSVAASQDLDSVAVIIGENTISDLKSYYRDIGETLVGSLLQPCGTLYRYTIYLLHLGQGVAT